MAFNEAPASATIKFILHGYDTMLTLRDESGAALLPKVEAAIEHLGKIGAEPTNGMRRNGDGNGGNGNAPNCPTHGKPMKPSQYGGWYCPVKIAEDDGTGKAVYCKQKVK